MSISRFGRSVMLIPALLLAGCGWFGADVIEEGGESISSAAAEFVSSSVAQENIRLTRPQAGEVVESPLTVSGEARGNWYFEASFPVRLLNARGDEIAVVPAQAQGEWMTTDFVPFVAVLTFTPDSQTGSLVLEKDNPSGLPEYAASVIVPVRFAQ